MLVLWLLLLNVDGARSVRSAVGSAVLIAVLGSAASHWRETMRWNPAWPVWPLQVDKWRREPNEDLHIWPRGWTMRLVPRTS